jgi:hypothetical protein
MKYQLLASSFDLNIPAFGSAEQLQSTQDGSFLNTFWCGQTDVVWFDASSPACVCEYFSKLWVRERSFDRTASTQNVDFSAQGRVSEVASGLIENSGHRFGSPNRTLSKQIDHTIMDICFLQFVDIF